MGFVSFSAFFRFSLEAAFATQGNLPAGAQKHD